MDISDEECLRNSVIRERAADRRFDHKSCTVIDTDTHRGPLIAPDWALFHDENHGLTAREPQEGVHTMFRLITARIIDHHTFITENLL